ncbi:Bcl-2-modifying factor [Dissostichus eleginoides]|uniref:Bcl-2-modifying factor n=1 Tax=Dissostichus eleginoides TaxID=100907 RepID=A0AAD9F4P9_DISEL|nr:Bcl-2-modifying factor [Dissostichus eleginoides]
MDDEEEDIHNNNSIGINSLPCGMHRQPRIPFHGNAGLRSHFPAQFEPMEDRGESVEAQIGRKLREIGDKFHQDHVELFMRGQRQNLPAWMRLTMALFGFLFPREALFPRLRGAQR